MTATRKLSPQELWTLCRKATIVAVRAPYSPDDRQECALDIFGDIVADVAAAETVTRHGRPADVLAMIDRTMRHGETHGWSGMREAAVMPWAHAPNVQFVAVRNRAADWRRKRDRQRARDALALGKTGRTAPAPMSAELSPAQRARGMRLAPEAAGRYSLAAHGQYIARTMAATREACERLGLPHGRDVAETVQRTAMISETVTRHEHSAAFCALYVWARGADMETCAAELGLSHANMRQRASRAAKVITAHASAADVLAKLCDGQPVKVADELQFALGDSSREAHAPRLTASWHAYDQPRDGTASGAAMYSAETGEYQNVWPERHETAASARAACAVRSQRPAPVASAQRAARALGGRDVTEAEGAARLALGAAITAASGRMPRTAVGRPRGHPAAHNAPRRVRLGRHWGAPPPHPPPPGRGRHKAPAAGIASRDGQK